MSQKKTSATRPKLKREVVQRAESEASTCFGAKQPILTKQ